MATTTSTREGTTEQVGKGGTVSGVEVGTSIQEDSSPKLGPIRLGISEAVMFGLTTALAYWLVFKYESGYLAHFGVPAQFVQIRTESFLVVGLALSAAMLILYTFANILSMYWPNNPHLRAKVIRISLMALCPIWMILSYGFRAEDIPLYAIAIGAVLIFEVLWPYLVCRQNRPFRERVEMDEVSERPFAERLLISRIFDQLGPGAAVFLAFFMLAGGLAEIAGTGAAARQLDFLVAGTKLDWAVIRAHPESAVVVSIDLKTRSIGDKVAVLKWRDGANDLYWKRIGPLKPVKGRRVNP